MTYAASRRDTKDFRCRAEPRSPCRSIPQPASLHRCKNRYHPTKVRHSPADSKTLQQPLKRYMLYYLSTHTIVAITQITAIIPIIVNLNVAVCLAFVKVFSIFASPSLFALPAIHDNKKTSAFSLEKADAHIAGTSKCTQISRSKTETMQAHRAVSFLRKLCTKALSRFPDLRINDRLHLLMLSHNGFKQLFSPFTVTGSSRTRT